MSNLCVGIGEPGRGQVTTLSSALGALMEMEVRGEFLHIVAARETVTWGGGGTLDGVTTLYAYATVDDRPGPRTVFLRRKGAAEPEVPTLAPPWGAAE